MSASYFVDTNVLIYCYAVTEPDKQRKAWQAVASEGRQISTQVLQEIANTLRRKFKKDWLEIDTTLQEIVNQFIVHKNTESTVRDAIRLANRYGYSFYDSLILAAALESGCSVLYSEDMQAEQLIDGVLTIRNPF
ncbi:PIN domain-containing protein [Spirosoma sp. KUDC1026]|uniref:PIN domain-containing protein n=1 Tax=Spirosoma sp. KUDC1026 TaxID=2745947 RepID=UPI00159BB8EF|nr:PIN domain-containing protein [Spirosoma sp. KUDC1026]QKZ12191.1 PIN domain-containing protein [Spirosoma sp. KUDC1026]